MHHAVTTLALLLAISACAPSTPRAGDADEGADMSVGSPLATYAPSDAEHDEVVATLQSLFDALATKDEELLRSVVDPSVVMHYSETRDGATTFGSSSLDGLAERVTSSEVTLIERMWDPVIVVNDALATIWTPYDFYAGETFSHCGVDAANLMRTDDGWKIVALSWTRLQPPVCALHPDGPPSG